MSGRRAPTRSARGRALALLAGALAAAAPAAAEPFALATAVAGEVSANGAPLRRDAALAGGERVKTGRDGAASLLLGEDALLEVCQESALRLGPPGAAGPPAASGPRELALERGELRLVAEAAGERG